jgi:hypothetical protein
MRLMRDVRWSKQLLPIWVNTTVLEDAVPASLDNPAFRQPGDSCLRVWRYMRLAKLVHMLSTGCLYFCRSDLLGDKFEGSLSEINIALRDRYLPDGHPLREALPVTNCGFRLSMFVNSWHLGEVESAAMWALYGRDDDAVAVCSTYARLADVLPNRAHLGLVTYLDYAKERVPDWGCFSPFMTKQLSFAHEREVRAIIWDFTEDDQGKVSFENTQEGLLSCRSHRPDSSGICVPYPT